VSERIYSGELHEKALRELLDLLFGSSSEEAYALLETVPDRYLDEQEQREGLQFIRYAELTDPAGWPLGRVFHKEGELRWQQRGERYRVVYAGSNQEAANYLKATVTGLEACSKESFYLWGERWEGNFTGEDAPGESSSSCALFLESQIPRPLRYPVSGSPAKRCKINVVAYTSPEQPFSNYSRFHSLKEVEE